VLQCVAVWCSESCHILKRNMIRGAGCERVWKRVCCSVLQCGVVCCSVLQCVMSRVRRQNDQWRCVCKYIHTRRRVHKYIHTFNHTHTHSDSYGKPTYIFEQMFKHMQYMYVPMHYMRIQIHTYIHAYIQTYIHTYIHTNIHTDIHTCIYM